MSIEDVPEEKFPRLQWLGRHWRAIARAIILVILTGALALVLIARITAAQRVIHSAAQTVQGGGGALTAAQPSQPAPSFTLHSWAWWNSEPGAQARPDQTMQLEALQGHPVVVNFWASWCDPCREEAPALEASWQRYRSLGIVFIGVNVQDTATDSAAFVKQYGVTYFTGPDATETITVAYAVPGIPTTVFIDRHGVIRSRMQGALDAPTLNRQIAALLAH